MKSNNNNRRNPKARTCNKQVALSKQRKLQLYLERVSLLAFSLVSTTACLLGLLLSTSAKIIPKKPFRPVEPFTVFYKSMKEERMKPGGLFYTIMIERQL